jgi:hypothetical protein
MHISHMFYELFVPNKCVYQAFIIQNLDVVILELGMKVCDLWKYYFNLTNYAQVANF